MSLHEPFHRVYEDYRAALTLAHTRGGRVDRAVALEREELLDAAWDRLSRMVPPLTSIGALCFTRRRLHYFLHAVGRQAVWPEIGNEVQDDELSLACMPGGGHRWWMNL
jgi:hypothetical protein